LNWKNFEDFPYRRAMELLEISADMERDEDHYSNKTEMGVYKGISRLIRQFLGNRK
jgi:hypothetical protein